MRRMLIRWLTPLAWRSGDARLARAIRRFADVEADSGWQALQLLYGVDDPALKAECFEIALEESAHSRMFRQVALALDREVERGWQPQGREALFDPGAADGAVNAVADLMVNERGVYAEFSDYERATRHPWLIAVFARIREDESEHGDCAGDMLAQLCGDPSLARRALRRAGRRRFRRNYMVGSKAVGGAMMGLLLRVAFFALGGFGRAFSGRGASAAEARAPRARTSG
jgi:rubrerythrin